MSISPNIVCTVVTCCAPAAACRTPVEPGVAVGHERGQADFLGQGQAWRWCASAVSAKQSQELALYPPVPPLPRRREPV